MNDGLACLAGTIFERQAAGTWKAESGCQDMPGFPVMNGISMFVFGGGSRLYRTPVGSFISTNINGK